MTGPPLEESPDDAPDDRATVDVAHVLQFAPRHPTTGMSPVTAVRRMRLVRGFLVLVVCLVAVGVAGWRGSSAAALTVAGWGGAEVGVALMQRHLDELGGIADVVRRHLWYLLCVCAVGVLLKLPVAAQHAMEMLAGLVVVQSATAVLLARPAVRRLIGMAAPPSVLVVANRATAQQVIEDRVGLTSSAVVGVCLVDNADRAGSVAGVPVLGTIDDALDLVRSLNIHEVAVRVEPPLDSDWLRGLEWALEDLGVRLTVVTKLRYVRPHRIRVRRTGSSVVLGVSEARPTGVVRHAKAVVEALVASVCFLVTLPVLVACALAIKLDSPGPAFFTQTRVREGNRTFHMVKLRTMRVDAELHRSALDDANEVDGERFKMRADPRVTRVGRVLRRLSLDELPQLLNVMRGDMSLVGPRPALPSEVARYDDRARRRLDVKPGLTGLWQVSGRSTLTWEESIALDLDYVDNWSAIRDVRIALKTIRAVAARDGAY